MNGPNVLDIILLLATGLTAAYMVWRFWQRYSWEKKVYALYYILSFAVLFVSGVLLIFMKYKILATPFILTVASLIPFGLSVGMVRQYFAKYTKPYIWFATIGLLAIAFSAFTGSNIKAVAVPLFHSVAGLIIVLGPFLVKKYGEGNPAKGFWWVSVGGVLISAGGMALAFLNAGSQLLFFSGAVVNAILAALLLLMALAFAWGFMKDIKN
ncbi:MAG: hypothetical protein HN390_05375 [Anaerolineae bacterium]|jgi:hypothetical protein|nr:hypothetical protein [Anaerolineae bacterium]MBT7190213.1 hypothetical protein [Anaerolineae bacterium]MBT7991385.1 hypothetical protein [Anaerolineae bacterium]